MTPAPAPHADFGVLGPDSVAWRVYGFPSAVTIAFQRTALTEMFHPHVVASVADSASLHERAADRYDRTLEYAGTLIFAGSAAAVAASDSLVRLHSHIHGTDPVTGQVYDPNDPGGQLWIHLTQWQSVLHVYQHLGPGPLSPEDDRRYWAECAEAALFQTIDPDDVPRSSAEMRAYYRRVRPTLAVSPVAVEHALLVLDNANRLFSNVPGRWGRLARPVLAGLGRRATLSTLPGWMREAIGVRPSPLADAVVRAVVRPVFRFLEARPGLAARILEAGSPRAFTVIAPVVLDLAPQDPVTVPVREAWRRAGRPLPREQYLAR